MVGLSNSNAPGQGGEAAKQATEHRKFTAKSTSTEAQRQRIVEALRTGPKTSYDLRRLGCYQQSTRIFELRRLGYAIETERITVYDRDGYMHPRCARYHLHAEPVGGLQ
jgi:hypothetical protein